VGEELCRTCLPGGLAAGAHEQHEPASTCWNGPIKVPQKEQGDPAPRLPCPNTVREDTTSYPCGETIHGIRIRTEPCGCPGMAQPGKVREGQRSRSRAQRRCNTHQHWTNGET
jgi:hypothetical protein